MRKLFTFFIVLMLLTSIASAQSVKAKAFRTFNISQLRNLNWQLKRSLTDTSDTFQSNSVMTIFGVAYDGVNGDSAHFKLHLDVYGVDGWSNCVKTNTVSDDSTEFTWELTATFLPSVENMRIRAEALGSCRKKDYITIKLLYKGTEPSWYY